MTSFNEGNINRDTSGKFAAKTTSETDSGALSYTSTDWNTGADGISRNPKMNGAGMASDFDDLAEPHEKVTASYTVPDTISGGTGARLTKKQIAENNEEATYASGWKPAPAYMDDDNDGISVYQTKEGGYVAVAHSQPASLGGKPDERTAAERARVAGDLERGAATYHHTPAGAIQRAKNPDMPPMPAAAMKNPTGGRVEIGSKRYDTEAQVIRSWKKDSNAEGGWAPTHQFVSDKEYAALFKD